MGSSSWRTASLWTYARNVKGLTLQNVRFEYEEADARPAVVLDNVQDALITGLSAQGSPQTELLRVINSKDVLFTSTRVLTSAKVFLQVEGEKSENIIVNSSDVQKAAAPVAFVNGANKKSVSYKA